VEWKLVRTFYISKRLLIILQLLAISRRFLVYKQNLNFVFAAFNCFSSRTASLPAPTGDLTEASTMDSASSTFVPTSLRTSQIQLRF
jgi:hypothetical protein